MSSEEIRKNLNLLENSAEPINEAPMGFFKMLATAASAVFSDVALGKLDTGKAANRTYNAYMKYLGKIGKNAVQGTVGDLYSFLARSGTNPKILMQSLAQGTGLPITNEIAVKKYWDTVIKTKEKISKTILLYVQGMSKLPEKDLEPADFAKMAATGSASVDRIEKAKAAEVGKTAATPTAAPAEPPADPIEKSIADALRSKDKKSQVDSIDAALKALGG